MTSRTARVFLALTGLLAVAAMPALAQSGGRYYPSREGAFRFHLGAFQLEGDSEYWRDKEADFTGSVDDYENLSFGLAYLLPLNERLSLHFSGTFFEGNATHAYRDFVDNFGDRIRHDGTLDIASATLGLTFHFLGPEAVIQPYVGAGGGAYPWRLEESGDFIGSGPLSPIFSDTLEADGTAFGYYGLVGLEAPITPHFSIYAEGRWTQVDDDLNGDLEGFGTIDLSSQEFAVGLSWNL